jgi:asparagine synthase (glutamine-hydrolysing)
MKQQAILFESLLTGDFVGMGSFQHFGSGNNHLFFSGKLFNNTPEIFLENYLKNGNEALKALDGDFLLIVANAEKLVFFRDRHGSGASLYFSDKAFSGQLIDFVQLQGFNVKPDIEALFTFLCIGFIPSPATSLLGVQKLAGGHILTFEKQKITTLDLFDFSDFLKTAGSTKLSIAEATTEYERLHKQSIANRIAGSEKVGLLLSGGYDSGGNISALRDIYQGDVVSYSIGFKDNPWTELPLAKILSERYKSRHFEYEIDGSEIMDLPEIVHALGDPFSEGGLMVNYSAMRIVKESGENPAVILGGDGNDQHFGTSGKELALHWKFKSNGAQLIQKLLDSAGNSSLFEKDNLFFRTEFHNRKILHIQQCDIFGFTRYQVNNLNSIGYTLPKFKYLQNAPRNYTDFSHFFYSRNFLVDIKQVINEVILYKASKMAAMFGNTISFPYMSTDLYNFLKQMPVDYKFHGNLEELSKGKGQSKYLHKQYLKPKLPSEITNRKKQGGFAPLPIFLSDPEQRKLIFEVIKKSAAVKALFQSDRIAKLLENYDKIANSGGYWFWFKQVQANQIINLLTLVVWWEIFIVGKKGITSVGDLS